MTSKEKYNPDNTVNVVEKRLTPEAEDLFQELSAVYQRTILLFTQKGLTAAGTPRSRKNISSEDEVLVAVRAAREQFAETFDVITLSGELSEEDKKFLTDYIVSRDFSFEEHEKLMTGRRRVLFKDGKRAS